MMYVFKTWVGCKTGSVNKTRCAAKSSLFLGAYCAALLITGCVSAPPSEPTAPGTTVIESNNLPPAPANETPSGSRASQALADLLADSRTHYDRDEYQAAIATAERALRIDRRQPDVYLLIALSYRALGDTQQALQFAEQGLRYVVDDDSELARDLNQLADFLR